MKLFRLKFKRMLVILILSCIIAVLCMEFRVGTFVVGQPVTTYFGAEGVENLTYGYAESDLTAPAHRIYIIDGNTNSSYGWCINKGTNLIYGGTKGKISESKDAYEDPNAKEQNNEKNKLSWLFDNMYRSGVNVPNEEKEVFARNLKSIVESNVENSQVTIVEDKFTVIVNEKNYDYSYNNEKTDYVDSGKYSIFKSEQFAIWKYTKNNTEDAKIGWPEDDPLYNALIAEADKQSGYDYTANETCVINKENAVLNENIVGPFSVQMSTFGKIYSNSGKLFKDKSCTQELEEYGIYNGDVYVNIENPIDNKVTLTIDSYKTVGTRYNSVDPKYNSTIPYQPFVILDRIPQITPVEYIPDEDIEIHKGVKSVENQDSGYNYHGNTSIVIENGEDTTDNDSNEENGNTENDINECMHEWVVETTIPELIANYNKYVVTDPIDLTKLSFDIQNPILVQRVGKDGEVIETLEKDKDYKVSYTADDTNNKGMLVFTYINKKDGENFHGDFLTAEGVKNRAGYTDTKIRATFYTTFKINENGNLAVLDGEVTNAENTSTLTYDNGNGVDMSKDSENPEVHTGAVSVFKFEDLNGNGKHDEGEKALVGAEFKIALTEQDAKDGKFVSINGEELVAISDEHGFATFEGLSFGGDAKDDEKNLKDGLYSYDWENASRDYYLVETDTPRGYKKLEDVIKVTVSKESTEIINLTDKIDEMVAVGNRPLVFDLALRKWVTQAIVTENGQTTVYETNHKAEDNPEDVVKVDLKKSNINDVTVKFKYSIRITNENEVAGEAQEITDYIPEGLKFVKEDNPYWETTDDERVVKTDKLKGVTLEQDESAEVEIVLTWINSESSMGVMYNIAEISKDYNEYDIHDIDSTPNNKVKGEDDIDDAPVMLSIKTGSDIIPYISIFTGFVGIIAIGAYIIKRQFGFII